MARPRVQRVSVELEGLPSRSDGASVAVVADLHGRARSTGVAAWLVRQVDELRADLIVLLGDMIHHPQDGARILRSLSGLSARLGVWACLGNHEHGFAWHSRYVGARRHPSVEEWRRLYRDAGVRLLANEAALLRS